MKEQKPLKWKQIPLLHSGQALITALVILAIATILIAAGLTAPVVREVGQTRDFHQSLISYYAAESGVEDATYRIARNYTYSQQYNLPVGSALTQVIVESSGNERVVDAMGNSRDRIRLASAKLSLTTTEVNFFYGIQVGDGGLTMNNNSRVEGNVFSNGNIIGFNNSKITDTAIVAGGINENPNVSWSSHNADFFFASTTASRDIAQSFTAFVGGKLNRVAVFLGKVGNPTQNIIVKIATNSGSRPSTSNIASAVITPAMVGTSPSWVNVAFASPPTLTIGSKYWIVLDYGIDSAVNHWNWRYDTTDGYLNNTGKYTDNCCSGSPTWYNVGGDLAFQVWIGGVNTKIEGLTIGDATKGLGKANSFVNTTIHGSSCPNQYCVVDNPARAELPISEGVIQDWRDAAAAGGTCAQPLCDASGNYSLAGNVSGSLGPIKIPGNLTLNNGATLTVTGTIWVQGTISFNNNAVVQLSPSYGVNSGVILGDGVINVNNGVAFSGSGDPASFIMLLSDKNDPPNTVMNINNNSTGVIYYASRGRIHFNNNATAKGAVGYGISMNNNAVVIYETGMANSFFSSGPGASFDIIDWFENPVANSGFDPGYGIGYSEPPGQGTL